MRLTLVDRRQVQREVPQRLVLCRGSRLARRPDNLQHQAAAIVAHGHQLPRQPLLLGVDDGVLTGGGRRRQGERLGEPVPGSASETIRTDF